MSRVEVWLDETPGETRGIIARDGRFEQLIIQRDDDLAVHRLGARAVGRVVRIEPTLKGVFVDLGGEPLGFLRLRPNETPAEGAALEVEVVAEPRNGKGPQLKLIGPASGEPRLTAAGPDVRGMLAALAPGRTPVGGAAAIQASLDAEQEALEPGVVLDDLRLDVMVERTRALIAVDLDLLPAAPGQGRQARDRANRAGLVQAARMIRLKSWGGLVAVDLIGAGHDGDAMLAAAKKAFGDDPETAYGPISRFGVLQLSLAWRRTPIEEVLKDPRGRTTLRTQAQDLVRRLRLALLTQTGEARLTALCSPQEAQIVGPWMSALGPRASLTPEPGRAPGRVEIREG